MPTLAWILAAGAGMTVLALSGSLTGTSYKGPTAVVSAIPGGHR